MDEPIDIEATTWQDAAGGGIHSPNRSMLETFLEKFTDASAYKITYTSDGDEHTSLVYDLKLAQPQLSQPTMRVRCLPLPPGTDSFTVSLDAIEALHTADPPRDRFRTVATRADERARGLRRLAQSNPESVAIPQVLDLLDRPDDQPPGHQDVVWATRLLAEARPVDCRAALPILDSLLAEAVLEDPTEALRAVAAFGAHDTGDIVALTDSITRYLTADDPKPRRHATRCIAEIAEYDPVLVLDTVPTLGTILETGGKPGEWAAYALSQITHDHPEAVTDVTEVLRSVVVDDTRDLGVRVSATAALGRVTDTDPSLAVDLVDDIAALLDADAPKLRNNGLALLGEIAQLHADTLTPYTDAIEAFLTCDDEFARVNASWVLATVAEDFPDAVVDARPTLETCLDDEEAQVRTNACYALGRIGAESVTDRLQELAGEDPDDRVRRAAGVSYDRLTN